MGNASHAGRFILRRIIKLILKKLKLQMNSKIVCGLHVEHNLQVVPAAYNMLKGNRIWPDMF